MARTIRLTITSDLEKALDVLRQSTLGTLNTTELIKMAIGAFARQKEEKIAEMTPSEMDEVSASLFYQWAKEDGSLDDDNILHPEKFKPYVPKEKDYVRAR